MLHFNDFWSLVPFVLAEVGGPGVAKNGECCYGMPILLRGKYFEYVKSTEKVLPKQREIASELQNKSELLLLLIT